MSCEIGLHFGFSRDGRLEGTVLFIDLTLQETGNVYISCCTNFNAKAFLLFNASALTGTRHEIVV